MSKVKTLSASVSIKKLPKKSMMSLHHELGYLIIDGTKIRFCQCINGACFWVSVGPKDDPGLNRTDLYQVDTEELMNNVVNKIMKDRSGA